MPSDNVTGSENGKFALRGLLQGHRGPVAAVAAHPLGMYVASGGKQGTLIWDLQMHELLVSPSRAANQGATLAIAWITHPDDPDEGVAFGTAQGYLEVFCDELAGGVDGQEISTIAYDMKANQLAIVHRSEVIHRFVLDGQMRPTRVVSVKITAHYPQAVAFRHTGVLGPEIWSFGRDDGDIHVLDEGGKIIKTKSTGVIMGHAAVNVNEDVFIVDDVVQGVALYKFSDTERIKTFPVPAGERRSRNVCFLSDASIIITGSHHGRLYAFERRTGDIYDVIDIGVEDWIQSVTTVDIEGVSVVIAGRSGDNTGKTDLQVWERVKRGTSPDAEGKGGNGGINCIQLICVSALILFILRDILLYKGLQILDWIRKWIWETVENLQMEWRGGALEKPRVRELQTIVL
ncbi:hypothetical protein E1B28_005125 [Marasmius oreades]|uniref:Uncharacterized protein n=1 Tax=Marasmius oreades TaxID=181124 RepID=A0A9P7UZZ2_9AGAR|nr:uncharacterized protein E1B28_005125 [Marasmius oreades]KAG7097806.1 hypothetical protein E1B28_005125 [Marasmius oreades]